MRSLVRRDGWEKEKGKGKWDSLSRINRRREEMAGLRIGSSDQDVVRSEDIPLKSRSYESLDVITRRDENLPTANTERKEKCEFGGRKRDETRPTHL